MEMELDEVLEHMSERGMVEWELAVEKAKNARLSLMLKQLMPFVSVPHDGDGEG